MSKFKLGEKIQELETGGLKVTIQHLRWRDGHHNITPKGGTTRALIYEDEKEISVGYADCSKQDNYSRRVGALIALGRALKKLSQVKE